MCGIVGYAGRRMAAPILMEGLKRLEYRGYDSAGIAVNDTDKINIVKKKGKLLELEEKLKEFTPTGNTGIGHTRWATHGKPSDKNSHPHSNQEGDIALVHNGIIENYQQLKKELLAAGYRFRSETDTEVIAHLLDYYYHGNLRQAVLEVISTLEGSYALAILSLEEPGKIIAVRQDSPLIVGKNKGENYVASDIPAFLQYTDEFYILDDGEIAEITEERIELFNAGGREIKKEIMKVDWDAEMAEKNGFPHYMLKEIHEQPDALRRVLNNRISPAGIDLSEIQLPSEVEQIQLVACGTASYSCMVGKYLIEELTGIPVSVEVGSEYRYRNPILNEKTLVVVVSQSGETADTLAGLRLAREKNTQVLAVTNVVGSSIDREADEVIHLKAGPEIAVASTKAYLTMLVVFYLLAVKLSIDKNLLPGSRQKTLISDILRLPDLAARTIEMNSKFVADKAAEFRDKERVFYIGRNTDYPLVLEGALKMKEIAYIQAEAYPAGELKHGTLALIEEGVPVIALLLREKVVDKMISNVAEVKSRGGNVIAVSFKRYEGIETVADDVIYIPEVDDLLSGALAIIPLQLLAYYTALEKGCNIDQPRNLAKSVTVE